MVYANHVKYEGKRQNRRERMPKIKIRKDGKKSYL